MKKRELSRSVRVVSYYATLLLSLGLIWGGGMASLRGNVLVGLVAIVVGVALQAVLKKFDIDEKGPYEPECRRLAVHDSLREPRKQRAVEESAPLRQRTGHSSLEQDPGRSLQGRGSDGATLMIRSKTDLHIR